jgi:hypothetical protein
VVAKEFGVRPSDYLPELGWFEAFCLDEVCTHMLIHMRDEARKEVEEGRDSDEGRSTKSRGSVSLDWMWQQQKQREAAGG